jgi:uncharacterized protein (DUF1800 family)
VKRGQFQRAIVITILLGTALSASARKPKPKARPNAQFVGQAVPATMVPGQSYNVSVTMQNTGTKQWGTANFQLVSQNPAGNTTWGSNSVGLSQTAPRGSTSTFNFAVSAPNTPGSYNFQWQMAQGGTGFGQASTNVTVAVAAPTPTPSPSVTPTPTPSGNPSTVFIAHLRPALAGASGTGTAILKVAADEASATLAFSFSNLSGPVTAMHVHGPANPGQSAGPLYDPDEAQPRSDGTYLWTFVPVGINSVADIVAAIKAGRTYFNIHTAQFPSGEITGFFNLAGGSQSVPLPTPPPPLPGGTPTAEDAARFLNQCTGGATAALIQEVQRKGFSTFLDEQFALPASSNLRWVDRQTAEPGWWDTMSAWWTLAVTAPDQVRQRVAFALSEILVTSFNDGDLSDNGVAMSGYIDILANNAFGNYRQLLQEVTLSPTMGVYLDMLGNDKGDPESGQHPNENYARELMQLFSVGLFQLNIDGSLALNGDALPIPTYDQSAVEGLAAVTTGWTFAGQSEFWDWQPNYRQPMSIFPEHHEAGPKQILSGVVIPPAQAPAQDLNTALNTIFNHPNVGRFVGRQLIQRLVTSNPTPGYVYRVAAAFDNNGQGVRGDMKAVIKAILLDYDARGGSKTGQGAGKLREPVLRLTHLYRSLGAHPSDGIFAFWIPDEFGEQPLNSPTVFNFFTPDYVAPGGIALAGLYSPEFKITTETTVVAQANQVYEALFWEDIPLDFSAEDALSNNPSALVDLLNVKLMNGAMSSAMRQALIDTINQMPADDDWERVRSAVWLVLNSPEYVVEK